MSKEILLNQDQGYNVSDRYSVVQTGELLSQFESNGYEVSQFQTASVRKAEKQGFQKHILRLRHPDLILPNQDGLQPEVVLINSYDRSSSFCLMLGIFRFICSNGLISGNSYESLRVRHVGDVMPKVLAAAAKIQQWTPRLNEDISRLTERKLSQGEIVQFANDMAKEYVSNRDDIIQLDSSRLLTVNRSQDRQNDAFTILNVIQENLLLGRVSYTYQKETEKGIETKTRNGQRVRSIARNTELNQKVWDRAAQFLSDAA